jgi:hypothetical protein
MPWIKNNGSKYHTQDTYYYCGGACAMMVLAEIGVPYGSLDQDDLYTSNNTHNAQPGWYSDPEGIRYTMVDRKPAAFANTFVVYRKPNVLESSQKLVYTLLQYGVSPIALIFGDAHWVVVCGVQTNVNPATGPYTIEGFWINNPIFEGNEPHAGGDICGTGSGEHGSENAWVSYDNWQGYFHTGCNYDSPDGSLQFLSVCDPEPPKIPLPQQREPVRYFNGRSIADPRKILAALKEELKRYALLKTRQTARAANGRFAAPLLVHRLDDEAKYYYLVPSMQKTTVLGYAQVDALYGNLLGLYSVQRGGKLFETNRNKIAAKLVDTRIELPREQGRYRLEKGKFKIEPNLVWRPCRESFSPHLPFWRIVAEPFTFYQRIDGPVFAQLTLGGRGV